MRREFGGGGGVIGGRRRSGGGDREFVEVDGGDGVGVPSLDPELGLAAVGGGADEVDRDVVGGDKAGEVEELVEVAL